MRRNLGQRPIAPQIKVDHRLLVRGEQRSIPLIEGKRATTGLQGVKGHTLTV